MCPRIKQSGPQEMRDFINLSNSLIFGFFDNNRIFYNFSQCSFLCHVFFLLAAYYNSWLDSYNWKNPLECSNDNCYSHNLTWNNGKLLEGNLFDTASLELGSECWVFQSNNGRIISAGCVTKNYIACQVDCRPGSPRIC